MNYRDYVTLHPVSDRMNIESVEDFSIPDYRMVNLARAVRGADKVVLMMGAHPVKCGLSPYIIDMIRNGDITHVAMNGAATIHDLEIAWYGGTSESIVNNIVSGKFGTWRETTDIYNDAIGYAGVHECTMGEALATMTMGGDYQEYSILAACRGVGIPITAHVTIGTDIVHYCSNLDGATLGAALVRDMDTYINSICELGDGVVINMGSAVTMPELFIKSLNLAINVGGTIGDITIANMDMNDTYRARTRVVEIPRSVGATTYDIRGRHQDTVPALWMGVRREG